MAERRPLTSAFQQPVEVDPARAKEFVYGGEKSKPDQMGKAQETPPVAETREGRGQPPISRSHLTTRLRSDFASAVKNASLERQLKKQYPNTIQHILEEALEPWLRANGYIE
jgi:hypothetical protein